MQFQLLILSTLIFEKLLKYFSLEHPTNFATHCQLKRKKKEKTSKYRTKIKFYFQKPMSAAIENAKEGISIAITNDKRKESNKPSGNVNFISIFCFRKMSINCNII